MISTKEVTFCFHVSQVKVEVRKIERFFLDKIIEMLFQIQEGKLSPFFLPEQSCFSVTVNVICILQWKYLLYI